MNRLLDALGLLVLFILFSIVEGINLALDQRQASEFPKARRLSAASLSPNLKTREDRETFALKREASFHFMHAVPEGDAEYVFTTTLNVASQLPILALEVLDADLDGVLCSESHVQLLIGSLSRSRALKEELEAVSDFVIVTSHEGCDLEGERSIHRVTKTTVDLDRRVITLNKVKSEWHDAIHSTQVSFSHRHRSGVQKRTYSLHEKRQEQSNPPTSTKVVEEGPTPLIPFPTAPTATTGLPSTATKSLDMHYIDRKIFPPDIPAAGMFLPQGVTVTCKNCTLQGNIEITGGSFNLSGNAIKDTVAFFDHGALEILSNRLFAQIELGLDLSLNQTLASLNMSLPTIPLTPFEIPGVVAFGPIIRPELKFSIGLVEKIGFSYGFNLSVPDNSKIKINMSEPRNSSISGFGKTKFHALPFKSTSALPSLTFNVTFTPQILLGVSTAKGLVTGGIGAFVNLPRVSVNATQLRRVNANCEPVAGNTTGNDSSTSALENVFDSLTRIAPSVDINMGILANMQVDIAQFHEKAAVKTALGSTSYPLPTVCLEFDPRGHRYGAPSRTPSASTTSRSSKGTDVTSSNSDKESYATKMIQGPSFGLLRNFASVSIIAWILMDMI
ncbi:hypothetical protein BDV28DRAFT_160850 [Aspergillus coremiiformis]|uniref:GPI anchored protein n=1 Tax=Aspergillus coremiiformis TaxID=138285 RepID=A0A5N6YU30_9EURO|nr:hypothetical protein BDV28DRAFT_160850 [Aspergillus coremiiformis]